MLARLEVGNQVAGKSSIVDAAGKVRDDEPSQLATLVTMCRALTRR